MTRREYVARRWCVALGLVAMVALVLGLTGDRPGAWLLAFVVYALAIYAGMQSRPVVWP